MSAPRASRSNQVLFDSAVLDSILPFLHDRGLLSLGLVCRSFNVYLRYSKGAELTEARFRYERSRKQGDAHSRMRRSYDGDPSADSEACPSPAWSRAVSAVGVVVHSGATMTLGGHRTPAVRISRSGSMASDDEAPSKEGGIWASFRKLFSSKHKPTEGLQQPELRRGRSRGSRSSGEDTDASKSRDSSPSLEAPWWRLEQHQVDDLKDALGGVPSSPSTPSRLARRLAGRKEEPKRLSTKEIDSLYRKKLQRDESTKRGSGRSDSPKITRDVSRHSYPAPSSLPHSTPISISAKDTSHSHLGSSPASFTSTVPPHRSSLRNTSSALHSSGSSSSLSSFWTKPSSSSPLASPSPSPPNSVPRIHSGLSSSLKTTIVPPPAASMSSSYSRSNPTSPSSSSSCSLTSSSSASSSSASSSSASSAPAASSSSASSPRALPASCTIPSVEVSVSVVAQSPALMPSSSLPASPIAASFPSFGSIEDAEEKRVSIIDRKELVQLPEEPERDLTFWHEIVLDRWSIVKDSPVVIKIWDRDGVPASMRGAVWAMAIGNAADVAPDAYITVRRQIEEERLPVEEGEEEEEAPEVPPAAAPGEEEEEAPEVPPAAAPEPAATLPAGWAKPAAATPSKLIPPLENLLPTPGPPASRGRSRVLTPRHSFGNFRNDSIDADLLRMFPKMKHSMMEKTGSLWCNLRELLQAFCSFRPDVSYIQGMSYLAAVFLVYMPPEKAFVCLVNLIRRDYFPSYMQMDALNIRVRFQVFEAVFEANLPSLFQKFTQDNLLPDCYLMEWLLTLFSKQLPLDIVSRIWDNYLLHGEVYVFKVACGLLMLQQPKLIDKTSNECMRTLRGAFPDFTERQVLLATSTVVIPPAVQVFYDRRKANPDYCEFEPVVVMHTTES